MLKVNKSFSQYICFLMGSFFVVQRTVNIFTKYLYICYFNTARLLHYKVTAKIAIVVGIYHYIIVTIRILCIQIKRNIT